VARDGHGEAVRRRGDRDGPGGLAGGPRDGRDDRRSGPLASRSRRVARHAPTPVGRRAGGSRGRIGNGGYASVHSDVFIYHVALTNLFVPGTHVDLQQRSTQCLSDFSLDFDRHNSVTSTTVPGPDFTVQSITSAAAAQNLLLRQAEACTRSGEIGAVLRREGLYTSHLTAWRKQRDAGALEALGRPRGRKPADRRDTRIAALQRRAERAEAELVKARKVIEVQGNVSALVGERPAPARALSETERAAVLAELCCERFVDSSPAQVWATLLDEGTYLASERTMYRLLAAEHDGEGVRERRDQRQHPAYAKPELLAERPNELYSWDIAKLLGPAKWTHYYLYVILDVFSRYAVGWTVRHRESAQLAKALIAQTVAQQQIAPGR
jgi:transposase InsO family protein